jgi:DNA-binding response OmpR family regulator
MSTILLVEDEPDLVLGLTDSLEFAGYLVLSVGTVSAAQTLLQKQLPDLCIVDVMLPDRSGLEFCTELRKKNASIPILILTAKSQEQDKLKGFAVGADDYVTKPFSVAELLARVGALLRRSVVVVSDAPKLFSIGDSMIDGNALAIRQKREEHPITLHEYKLLEFLYVRANHAVSRDDILDAAWGTEAFPTPRTIDNFIVRLRKKIEPDPQNPKHILTIYGIGYKLVL